MPTTTKASAQFRYLGAASHGAAQTNPNLSLGNFIASTLFHPYGFIVTNGMKNVRIDEIATTNTVGDGAIIAVGNSSLAWLAPGSATRGTAVTIANGETKVLSDGADTTKWIKVTRTSTANLTGTMTVKIHDVYNNLKDNWSAAEQAAGDTEYRGVGVISITGETAGRPHVRIAEIGTATTVGANYAALGAISITGVSYSDWPTSGYVLNADTTEVMYYTSRTATVLTVPAAGRDIWSEVGGGSAGTVADDLHSIPGCRIGIEQPSSQPAGNYANPANESTAPLGVTFTHPITWAAALVGPVALAAGEHVAVRIEYKLVAAATASASILVPIEIGWFDALGWSTMGWSTGGWSTGVADGTPDYVNRLRGRHRLANGTLKTYLLFRGNAVDPDPDVDAALESFDTLPYTTTATFGPSTDNRFVLVKQNAYGLRSKNRNVWRVNIDGSGNVIPTKPTAPRYIIVEPMAAGKVRVHFDYERNQDLTANRADNWAIWITSTGVAPNPDVDPPTATELMSFFADVARLRYTSATFNHGDTIKVIVRTRRAGTPNVDSANTTIYTVTASTAGPAVPSPASIHFRDTAKEFN